ncbi:MAG: patatin-like phospholipase family protein [Deltaproteobacteria bacterium]|nr:patatin-like phospholipase family protein [Deltaproteobacteria bacterium]
MGISIVQKSDFSKKKRNPKVALVLAGGAVSGGAFKVGGLKALNDFLVNRKVTDFDVYIGLSAGAFLAAPLAGGVSPEEMLKSLDGSSSKFKQLRPVDFYYPNFREWVTRPLSVWLGLATFLPAVIYDFLKAIPALPGSVYGAARTYAKDPSYTNFEAVSKELAKVISPRRQPPSLFRALPSGIFDNVALERYLAANMASNGIPNDFSELYKLRKKELYIAAMNLDTAERVIFGHNEVSDVTISEAVQASTALPGFYKPARIRGVDYVDGGVRHTANIDIAIDHGADLIICYNPFRPFHNRVDVEAREVNKKIEYVTTKGDYLASRGMRSVLNQVFRTLLHSRLQIGLRKYVDDMKFKGDIILIEPQEQDIRFFEINPLAFWDRAQSAERGFHSVKTSIEKKYPQVRGILSSYGIETTRIYVEEDIRQMRKAGRRSDHSAKVLRVLERETPKVPIKLLGGSRKSTQAD